MLDDVECLGELALSGEVRAVKGVLPAALAARKAGRTVIVPRHNAEEACLASGLKVIAVDHLLQVVAHLNGHVPIEAYKSDGLRYLNKPYPDLSEVQGQLAAKRALLIAAAGAHNLLFSGPPGTGKTLLASRLPGLLPPLSEQEALEVAAIQSVVSLAPLSHWPHRPFRQPHHSASGPALVGGGSRPQPGEITLAHHGVLFLDELPEFDRKVLEVLREPLENGSAIHHISSNRFLAVVAIWSVQMTSICHHPKEGSHVIFENVYLSSLFSQARRSLRRGERTRKRGIRRLDQTCYSGRSFGSH